MKNNDYKKLFLLLLIIILAILLTQWFDLISYLQVDKIKQLVAAAGIWGTAIFIFLCYLAILLFLPQSPLNIMAGALFATWLGTIFMLISALLSSLTLFLVARYFAREAVENFLAIKFPKVLKYAHHLTKKELLAVFIARLPSFPFPVMSLALGLTKVSLTNYFWGTLIGILPWTIIYVYFGQSLFSPNPWHLIIAGILIIIAFTFYIYFKEKILNKK